MTNGSCKKVQKLNFLLVTRQFRAWLRVESGRCGTIPVVTMCVGDVDWSGLFHAQGRASDIPRHLKALLGDGNGDDARAAFDGYSHNSL